MERRGRKSKPDAKGDAASRALRLLARREHTRRELEVKLAPHVDDPVALGAVLDDLTERGWLSDARAVEEFVRSKRGRVGAGRIRQALVERGVSEELIATALQGLNESELERARAIWVRRFPQSPTTTAERARQVRFLQSRGFSLDVALRVVRSGTVEHG